MAKVKIQGHASGTGILTVTAPNTSSDRTITLPDETATLSTFDPDGAVTINDTGADVDFRVESDGNSNMLFVDGGNNRVGIGTNAPQNELHVESTNPNIRLTDSDSGGYYSTVAQEGASMKLQQIQVKQVLEDCDFLMVQVTTNQK